MLDGLFVDEFVGATVYQAFLSADNYHRWHSPVTGTIKKIHNVEGTYFSEAPSEGFDPAGPCNSQGYIAHTAARVLVFVEADEPIGLICLIAVGMGEVSSCIATVEERSKVKKGRPARLFPIWRLNPLPPFPERGHFSICGARESARAIRPDGLA
jgi:phosphatidylserine decarboxylase